MKKRQQTIEKWNLNFLEDYFEMVSTQDKNNTIDWINITDKEAIEDVYKALTTKDNIVRIQNGEYPAFFVNYATDGFTKSYYYQMKSIETSEKYIIELTHHKTKKITSIYNDPVTYLTNNYQHILSFDKNNYQIQLETKIIPQDSFTLQPSTKRSYTLVNNKTFETELERLMNEREKEYSEEEEIFFRSIITPSKVFNSAMKNNYSYNHMLYDPKGDYLYIKVNDDIYYDYTHTDKDGNIKYYIIVEISPESIEIRKKYPALSEDSDKGNNYESYEEFYEDIEDIKEENKLLQKLEQEIRKIQFLGLYTTFENNKAKEKTKTITQRNYIEINQGKKI